MRLPGASFFPELDSVHEAFDRRFVTLRVGLRLSLCGRRPGRTGLAVAGRRGALVDEAGVLAAFLPGQRLERKRLAALPLAGAGSRACCPKVVTAVFGPFSTISRLTGAWRNGERPGNEGIATGVASFWVFAGSGRGEAVAALLSGGSSATRGRCSANRRVSMSVASSWIFSGSGRGWTVAPFSAGCTMAGCAMKGAAGFHLLRARLRDCGILGWLRYKGRRFHLLRARLDDCGVLGWAAPQSVPLPPAPGVAARLRHSRLGAP